MSEETEDGRLTEAVQTVNAFRALKKSEGWAIFVDIMNKNIHDRTQQIVLRPSSEVPDQEFMKGEAAGMTVMLAFVDAEISACEDLIAALEEKDNGEEESG